MINTPLRYPGGKSRAIKIINDLIPEFKEFREPFVGGGSIFINQQQLNETKKFWINDLYEPVYNFWVNLKHDKIELVNNITQLKQKFISGKELFTFLKESYNKLSNIQKAAAFFILNRSSFSGTTDSGGFSQQAFDGRFTPNSIEKLNHFDIILKDTEITNFDYEKLVNKEGEDVFIYLDPPYFSAKKSALYGKNGNMHKNFDHDRFSKVMKNCNHKWLITYDDSEYIRKLFGFANISQFNLKYGMRNVSSNNQIGNELLITNY